MKNFKDTEYYLSINYLIDLLKEKYSVIKNITFIKEEGKLYYFKCNDNIEIEIEILVISSVATFIEGYKVTFKNKTNNLNIPNKIFFNEHGLIRSEEFRNNKKLKYETLYRYYANENLKEKLFFNDKGELHREDGPAVLKYDMNGKLKKTAYYLKDKKYDEFQYLVKLAMLRRK